MEIQNKIQEQYNHSWFTQLPNLVFKLGLCVYEFRVYSELKRIAGDNGNCFYSNKNLAELCGISEKKLRLVKKSLAQPRQELEGRSLITVTSRVSEKGDRETDLIRINFIWDVNIQKFMGTVQHTRGVRYDIPEGPVQHTDKEEPLEKEPEIITLTGVKGDEPPTRAASSSFSAVSDSLPPATKSSACRQKEPSPPPGSASPPSKRGAKISRAEHVATTNEEHQRLIEKYGEAKVQEAYQMLSEWKLDTPKGKWKKDDNRTLRRWVFDAIEERKLRQKKLTESQDRYKPKQLRHSNERNAESCLSKVKIVRSDNRGRHENG